MRQGDKREPIAAIGLWLTDPLGGALSLFPAVDVKIVEPDASYGRNVPDMTEQLEDYYFSLEDFWFDEDPVDVVLPTGSTITIDPDDPSATERLADGVLDFGRAVMQRLMPFRSIGGLAVADTLQIVIQTLDARWEVWNVLADNTVEVITPGS